MIQLLGIYLAVTMIVFFIVKMILEMVGSKDGCFLDLISLGIGALVAFFILVLFL